MRIGQLARESGLSTHALRFYERVGLLRPSRTAGGYRDYPPATQGTLRAIRFARSLGFTLREIATTFGEVGGRRVGKRRKRELLEAKRDELRAKRADLSALLRLVNAKIAALERDAGA